MSDNINNVSSEVLDENLLTEEAATNINNEEPTVNSYDKIDMLVAWVSVFIGYLVCRLLPIDAHPLGMVLFNLAVYAAAFTVLFVKRIKPDTVSVISASIGTLLSVGMFITDDAFISGVSVCFWLLSFVFFFYSATGNALEKGLSNYLTADFFRALVVFPISSCIEIFSAAFSHKHSSGWKMVGKLILGLSLAVIPTGLIVVLLSYDAGFAELITNIFDFNLAEVFSHIGSVILGIPVAMYLFGLYVSTTKQCCEEALTAEDLKRAGDKCRVAAKSVMLMAVLPILLVYCIFFISQWKYYVSAFTGVLPEEFSYAEYAREGFFQLCTVAIINFLIIKVLALVMKRDGDKISISQRIVSVLFAVSTLVLISTALAKMIMYIDIYGLTRKRVYVSVFMVMIAIVFVLEVVRQFVASFKSVPISALVCVVLFLGLSLCDVNGIIMKYNVNRYFDGSLETVDVSASYELGDSAVPELVRLAEHLDEKYGSDITKGKSISADAKTTVMYAHLYERLREATKVYKDDGIFSQSVPKLRAKTALEKIGYTDYVGYTPDKQYRGY